MIFKKNYNNFIQEDYQNYSTILTKNNLNSKLDALYYNKNSKNFKKISLDLYNHNNKIILKDCITSTINIKNKLINSIKSSFIDTEYNSTYNKNTNLINKILKNLNIFTNQNNIINLKDTKINSIKNNIYPINKNIIQQFDKINEIFELEELETLILEMIILILTIPIINFPLFYTGCYGFKSRIVSIDSIKILENDIEIKEISSKIINNTLKLFKFIDNYVNYIYSKLNKNFLIFFNNNYNEIIIKIIEKNINKEFNLCINPFDLYRLIRIIQAESNGIYSNIAIDFLLYCKSLNMIEFDIPIHFYNGYEYISEYYNILNPNRYEDELFLT